MVRGHKDRWIMGIDLSDNYIMVETLIHADITFFTQDKQINNHPSLADILWDILYSVE
jgi:hypothetical protein